MRIATSTMTNLTTGSIGNSYSKYADIIKKITANKNFTKVSENVADATCVLKLNDQIARLNEYQGNIKAATNEMNLAYNALDDVVDEINNINRLLLDASNATTTPESAIAIADEIQQRVITVRDKMNQKYLDNYIFSGTYTQEQTFSTDDDGNVIYNGSPKQAGDRHLTIAEDTIFTYNFTAEEIFGKQDEEGNFFKEMKELDELMRDPAGLDYNAIRAKITVATDTATKAATIQGQISAKVSKLDSASEINDSALNDLTEQKIDFEEVDISKAATDLANARTALQASYLIGSNVLQSVSLLNYL